LKQQLLIRTNWLSPLQYNYPIVEEILKKRLDQLQAENKQTEIPPNDNIREKNITSNNHKEIRKDEQ
jgi:hypothetical protein